MQKGQIYTYSINEKDKKQHQIVESVEIMELELEQERVTSSPSVISKDENIDRQQITSFEENIKNTEYIFTPIKFANQIINFDLFYFYH